nr:transporter [uncultured Novosphingobium sp.]
MPHVNFRHVLWSLLALGCSQAAGTAQASEGGTSIYLLGSGGPAAAVQPPVEGIFVDDTMYFYGGDIAADKSLVVGGNVALGLDSFVAAQFTTLVWVPSTKFLGGTLALGGSLPLAAPFVDASVIVAGPGGQSITRSRTDNTLAIGDPLANMSLGWKWDKFYLQVGGFVNIPVGHYREGELANIAFHRWAGDASLAASWHDTDSGWDVSAKAGVTFNGNNKVTDYNTGNELHVEAAVEKSFSEKFSAGIVGYYYDQISGDTGEGAVLGPNKGRVAALGGTAAYNLTLGRSPATFRVRVFQEFDARRRQEGTAGMLSLTLPLKIFPPAAATN